MQIQPNADLSLTFVDQDPIFVMDKAYFNRKAVMEPSPPNPQRRRQQI